MSYYQIQTFSYEKLHLLLMQLLLVLMRLASSLSTFIIKGNPVFSNGPISLPKNPPDFPILCN